MLCDDVHTYVCGRGEEENLGWEGGGSFMVRLPSETHFRVAIASAKGISSPNSPPCTLELG